MSALAMEKLQQYFNAAMQKQVVPARVLGGIIAKKLKAQGIKCSPVRARKLGEQIAERLESGSATDEDLTIVVTDGSRVRKTVSLELTAEDFDKYAEEVGEGIGKQLLPLAKRIAKLYLSSIRRRDYEGMRERRADLVRFRKNLRKRWGGAFDAYERLLAVAGDAGDAANRYLRSGKPGKPGARVDALSRVHARATQVAGEILTLLEHGFGDGAHARWRTLHELSVVAALLSAHDDEFSERYLQHEVVESLRAARQLKDYAGRIAEKPLSKRDFEKIERMAKTRADGVECIEFARRVQFID